MTSFCAGVTASTIGMPRELNTTQALFANVAPSQGRVASVGPPGAPLRQGGACVIAPPTVGGGAPTAPGNPNVTLADRFIPGTAPPPGPPPGPRQAAPKTSGRQQL